MKEAQVAVHGMKFKWVKTGIVVVLDFLQQ